MRLLQYYYLKGHLPSTNYFVSFGKRIQPHALCLGKRTRSERNLGYQHHERQLNDR